MDASIELLDRLQHALAGRYDVARAVGRGGMATVYLAHDRKHDRPVAIKVLNPDLVATLGAERFLREVRLTAQLNHPHILPLLDSGDEGGLLYYIMPYQAGETLRERLRRERRLPVGAAVTLAREIADALGYAHERGLVHRDVKPENVLLASGHGVLSDFGIARAVDVASSDAVTQSGLALGTPAYMSPEQVAGEARLDGRSDIFSLGCVLFEMLGGEAPFTGPTPRAVMARRLAASAPDIGGRRTDVPAHVARAVARALAVDPADRFQRAADFAGALVEETVPAPWDEDASPGHSIAVLPFTNMSGEPDREYFSDGIAEEIMNALARVPRLRVAARTSSFAFKGAALPPAEIGARLKVATLLEGSVRSAAGRVRITVRLVDVAAGYQLWSEQYDRELGDIFAIQDDVARSIVQRLELTLDGVAAPVTGRLRPNVEAYQMYLKGRYFWHQRGPGLTTALACFEQALALDDGLAPAHAGVADALTLLAFYGARAPHDIIPRAKAAVARALALDARLAEAHTSLGLISWLYDWDWDKGEGELRRAIACDPRHVVARCWRAALLLSRGDATAAIAEDERAVGIEPLSAFANVQLGMALLVAGHTDRAMRQLRAAIELDPHFSMAHWVVGCAHALAGRYEQAIAELGQAVELSRRLPGMVASQAAACAEAGRTDEARALLAELHARADHEYVPGLSLAAVWAALGEKEEAFGSLERAVADRDVGLPFLRDRLPTAAGFGLTGLRDDPRYTVMLRTIGSP